MIDQVGLERMIREEAAESKEFSKRKNDRRFLVSDSTARNALRYFNLFTDEVKSKTGFSVNTLPEMNSSYEGGMIFYIGNKQIEAFIQVSPVNGANYSFRFMGREYEGKLKLN
ncbi:MAG: hypothetical protein Q7S56_00745 [Nanoarchaeota archaeon]|nr:hypothetical protein [Nanoarchaeota archaeon]